MAIPVIDFSKLEGEERAKALAQIANGCEEWGFFQVYDYETTNFFYNFFPFLFDTELLFDLKSINFAAREPWDSGGATGTGEEGLLGVLQAQSRGVQGL